MKLVLKTRRATNPTSKTDYEDDSTDAKASKKTTAMH